MNWLKDPFRSFLTIYGLVVLVCILLLLFGRQNLNQWLLEKSAAPLLDAEATLIEQQWYEEGPGATRDELRLGGPSLFTYRFSGPLDENQVPLAYLMDEDDESMAAYEAQHALAYDEEQSAVSVDLYLPLGANWQKLTVAINASVFEAQFFSFHLLIYTIIAILVLGFVVALMMVKKIQRRLVDINQTSELIRRLGDLSRTIPNENLTGPLAETITQLNLMLSDISQSVENTRQQANNIAHDLRTPLTTVYNRVQQLSPAHPELMELEGQLSKLLSTFNLLLRINRLETNGESPPLSPVELEPLAEDVADLYLPVLEEKEQTLRVEIAPDARVQANADLLFQVMCNLIDNASKFSPEGSLIAISATREQDSLELKVSDQGGGVDQQQLEKLCDRFYRADSSRHLSGNGLGLSFVRAATERMNGELKTENQPTDGKAGLSVTIRLPVR